MKRFVIRYEIENLQRMNDPEIAQVFFNQGVSIEMEIRCNERSSNLSLSRYKTISRVLVSRETS